LTFNLFSVFSAPKRPLSDIDQKLPLPLRERDGVRGIEKEKHLNSSNYHPHPSLPRRGGGGKRKSPDGNRVLFSWFMVSQRDMNNCG